MRKERLRTGMRVKVRCGDIFIVMIDTNEGEDIIVGLDGNSRLPFTNFTKDLLDVDGSERWDIMEVSNPINNTNYLAKDPMCMVLWERKKSLQDTQIRELR